MLEPMTSKEIERRVEGILMSVGVENELSYNVTKEDDGTYKRETVGSVPRLDHAKGELLALIQQARVDQTRVIRDRFVRSGWEYKWLTEVISELKGESK